MRYPLNPNSGAQLIFITAAPTNRLGRWAIVYQILIAAYVLAIILFNRAEGLLLATPKILAALIIFSFIINVIAAGRKIHIPMAYMLWGLWFFVGITSTLLSDHINLNQIITHIQFAAIGLAITNFLIWNRDTRFFILSIIAAVSVSSLWVLLSPESFMHKGGPRLEGTIGNPNTHGLLLSVALALAVLSGLEVKRVLLKLFLFSLAGLSFLGILQTGSRTAMLGGVVMGLSAVFVLNLYRVWLTEPRSIWKSLLLIFAVIPLVYTSMVTSEFWDRMERASVAVQEDPSADGSLLGRFWMVSRGLEIWADRPIMGYGFGQFSRASAADHLFAGPIGVNAHNNYVELLVATGLIGLSLYVSIYFYWAIRLYILRRSLMVADLFLPYAGSLVVVILIVASDMTRVSYEDKLTWLLFPWIVAVIHLLDEKARARSSVGMTERRG